LSVSVIGGSGTYTYSWAPAAYLDDPAIATPVSTPDSTINYSVSVNDGFNTVISSPVSLTVKLSPPVPTIVLSGDTIYSDATGGNQWYRYDEQIPGATGTAFAPEISGDYSTRITNVFTGCYSQSNIIPYYFTGFEGKNAGKEVTVYPNPFTDKTTISYLLTQQGSVKITLYDSYGKMIRSLEEKAIATTGKHSFTLNMEGMTAGIYFIRIETKEYNVYKGILMTK
jgi:hypothetical protein